MNESEETVRGGQPAEDRIPDVAVAQVLALAQTANVHLDMVDGQLVMRSSGADRMLWPVLRRFLAEIGVEAIARYFDSTTAEDRMRLAAVPAHPGPRPIGHRFPLH